MTPSYINNQATSTLQLGQKGKWDKLADLCKNFNVTGNQELIDLDKFQFTKNHRVNTIFKDDKWVPLTKQQKPGRFLSQTALIKYDSGGFYVMKFFLGIKETQPVLGKSITAATKLRSELLTDIEIFY